jgi:hypothetical protein
MKTIKITKDQYEHLMQFGRKELPVWAKLDLALSNKQKKKELAKIPKTEGPTLVTQLGQAFKKSYEEHFKHPYLGWGAKENGMLKHWLKSLSFEQAMWCVKKYPGWTNPQAIRSGHTLQFLIRNYHAMVTDFRRPQQKFEQLDAHKEIEQGVKVNAIGKRISDKLNSVPVSGKISHQTQGRIPETSSDEFSPERAFADPSDPFNDHSYSEV